MKKIISFIIIIISVGLLIFSAYGATQIIDFSLFNHIDLFTITSIYDLTGEARPGTSVLVNSGELVFRSDEIDVFPLAYLSLNNPNKIQFDMKSTYSRKGVNYQGSYFSILFDDGTFMNFYNNFDESAMYYVYFQNVLRVTDAFVVRDIDGQLYDLGKGVGNEYTNYIIEVNNRILHMTDNKGHSFNKDIGNRKVIQIMFHPLYQWYCTGTTAYLDNIIITTQNLISSIALTGQSNVEKGNVINLNASILPADAGNKNLTWTSSDTNIATVDGVINNAIVRGIKKGTVTITAAAQDGSGVSASKVINVTSDLIQGEAKYLLIDDIVKYQTGYFDSENDPKYKEEYKYIHNPYSLNGVQLDNTMGYSSFIDKWQDIVYTQFSKVGTYKIQYRVQDNPLTAANNNSFANYRYYSDSAENTIYVHRKPIALYNINGSTVTDNSYDLDHSVSHATRGIAQWEWQYVNSNGVVDKYTSNSKTDGVNKANSWLSAYIGVQYKLVLRVQDIEGAWSEPCLKTAGEISRPVADFAIDKNPILYKTDIQKITDMSYDTNGLTLSYQWTVTKGGQTVLNSTANDISSMLNQTINNLYPNVTGKYYISLKVTNSGGVQSDMVTKIFEVIVHNEVPTVNFNLVSNENPAWEFPKILGLHYLKYRPHNTFFYEEHTRFDTYTHDANPDNLGFIYNWKLERFAVKDINNVSGAAANTYSYTTQFPFVNSFKSQGLGWGAYKITLKVTDKPPIPPYQASDTKSGEVTKYYYIVPELNLTGNFESINEEIMVGDTIKLKAKTSKYVEWTDCVFDGVTYGLDKVSEDDSFAYWEKNIVVPESITESGIYNLKFVAKTTYGGNGNITREVQDNVPINIVVLKLINFRITNIVNHPHITFPYTKDMLISKLILYKTGYYVTIQIDSKGKPDNVYSHFDIDNNGTIEKDLILTKVASGDTETWQGKFYVGARLPVNTVISIKTDCKKGTTVYDYNQKEKWDGRSLIVNGSALMDGRINLTN